MNSESKQDPTGENSRRGFLQKIGAVAAVSSVAADANAQQPPAPPAATRRPLEPLPQPGPLSKQPMPTIRLGKHTVGRLIIGTNGIGMHYSTPLMRLYREWNTPEQQMKNFRDDAYFVRATVKSLIASRQLTIRISDKEDL
jgi:hypothetical protein